MNLESEMWLFEFCILGSFYLIPYSQVEAKEQEHIEWLNIQVQLVSHTISCVTEYIVGRTKGLPRAMVVYIQGLKPNLMGIMRLSCPRPK